MLIYGNAHRRTQSLHSSRSFLQISSNTPTHVCFPGERSRSEGDATTTAAMQSDLIEPTAATPLDLDVLESDPKSTFVLKVGTKILDFDVLYANEAFRNAGYRDKILDSDGTALLFRSWAQALGSFQSRKSFAGVTWCARLVGRGNAFKVIQALEAGPEVSCINNRGLKMQANNDSKNPWASMRSPIFKRSREDFMGDRVRDRARLSNFSPRTNLDARWEGLQTMMEMSDVGVFEYNTEGKLLHANEAWYRLR